MPSRSSASSESCPATVQPNDSKKAVAVLPLGHQLRRHLVAVAVVGGEQLGPVGGGVGAEAEDDRPRPVRLDLAQDQVGGAEQSVDGLPVGSLDRLRQRVEGPKQHRRRVHGEEWVCAHRGRRLAALATLTPWGRWQRSNFATSTRPSGRSGPSTASTWRCRRASASACSAPTAPASRRRCGCSPGRRSRTRRDPRPRPRAAAGGEGRAGGDGGHAAARQPRRGRHGRGQPRRLRPALPRADVREAVDRGLALARLTERRRDAVDKLSGGMRRRLLLARGLVHRPQLAPARRADRGPRPADPDRALVADRRPPRRGHDDFDVHPLHRGGGAPRRRGGGDGRTAGSSPAASPAS